MFQSSDLYGAMLQCGTNVLDKHIATTDTGGAIGSSEALVSIRQTVMWCYN
jgi:hypothetical protein